MAGIVEIVPVKQKTKGLTPVKWASRLTGQAGKIWIVSRQVYSACDDSAETQADHPPSQNYLQFLDIQPI